MREITKHEAVVKVTYASVDAMPELSPAGIAYLRQPGVALLGQTATSLLGLRKFLEGFEGQNFEQYLDDAPIDNGSLLSKFAGQVCYLSLGNGRSKNSDASKYFTNIKAQGHGSILEHPVYSFLLYGIDRAVTHELVRHRPGKAYSQVSQRFVGPEMLRYCMPAEMQGDAEAEAIFFDDILENRNRYERRIQLLAKRHPDVEGESKTEKRKRMQSFARRVLANEVEAPIVVSGNVRSWRDTIQARCAKAADRAIRAPIFEVFRILREINATGFDDFTVSVLPDGTYAATPEFSKV